MRAMKIPEILLVESERRPGSLASILAVIGEEGLVVEHLAAVRRDQDRTVWEITLEMEASAGPRLQQRIDALPTARLLGRSDRVFNRHRGGKIRTVSALDIGSLQILRDVYTPGVARVCLAIRDEPALAREFTAIARTVAIVTNGTAVLGLGDIGPLAGLPVMEGKAALMAGLAGLSGVPILVDEKDPQKLAAVVAAIAPSFGAIQLEDIAAPACFEVEDTLRARLDIPVLHDDQHGTAVVALAAVRNAGRQAGQRLSQSVVGQVGLGAAGIGIARLLLSRGTPRILGADLDPAALERFAALGGEPAELARVMAEADIVIATTGVRGLLKPAMVRPGQVILALSNPDPEIEPTDALAAGASFAADGKSINNVLGFPGLFRGALEAGARRFTDQMLVAAAETIADHAGEHELVPEPLDARVHDAVSRAVAQAARDSGACAERGGTQ
ncbi:NADP-dependent malic enzyme [Thioalkalivibrio sp. XN279]|uniref:NAD(P)-dependent malic enzyme n=1 Tax=Thioalkalivibrio sp. XN279 TaxID=2714953 RepID=UPI0019825B79|nr:NADP-dependent malic enzyme [Thioalkalivibrio sp. XN279]